MLHSQLLALAATTLFAIDNTEPYPRATLLIEPLELASVEQRTGWIILDARPRSDYDAGHVPGSHWVDHDDWSKQFNDGEDVADWRSRIGRLGMDTDSRVIIYDDNSAKDAARIWWILRYWGIERVRLLHGGWQGWQVAQLAIETNTPDSPLTTQPDIQPQPKRLATQQQLLDSLAGSQLQIVDARSEDEHCGIAALSNRRAGAIPGARHLEWSDLINAETQRFKPAKELTKLFEQAGIDPTRPTATHCQSGGRAAVMAFGLELMGAPQVSNYYRSWSEWGNVDDTPIEQPSPPARDTRGL